MYVKLALRNIKRSVKNYTIYFLTLIFGVCIFYTFNAIGSQKVMLKLSDAQKSAFEMTSMVMTVASVFISFILGFLIIYASNYLIKRRKKEFGIYLTLGMEKGSLSKIIYVETIIIGIVSLIIGLMIGIFLSQGLSILTANLFKVDISEFKFIFSKSAFIKTIVCFAIIYLIVLLFNSIVINKVKLIDLLNASKKNESIKVRKLYVSIIVFIVSVVLIGTAYYMIIKNGISVINSKLFIIVAMGAMGTFLFFFSLSGFLLIVAQSNKRLYFKNLNMFVLRQINSKINTTFISMTFICLMLFVGICTLSGGLGINKALNNEVDDLAQFDVSLWSYVGDDIEASLNNIGVNLNQENIEYSSYNFYETQYTYKDLLDEEMIKRHKNYYPIATNSTINVIKLSEFNSIMKLLNQEEIKLNEGEYIISSDIIELKDDLEFLLNNNKEIEIHGAKLLPANNKVIDETLSNQVMKNNLCTLVVNDEVIGNTLAVNSYMNINYEDSEYIGKNIEELRDISSVSVYYLTKEEVMANSAGIGVMIAYLGIYLGIIFLITSAAVLALQQLSESADNITRYSLLKKIGVDDETINKSIFTQLAIYFMVPLLVAIIHSIIGLKVSSDIVSIFGNENMIKYIIIAIFVLIIVYGGYFLATYTGAKKIMNSEKMLN